MWHLWDPQYSLDFVWLDAAQEVACAFSRRQRAGGLFSSARGRSFLRSLTNSEASSSLETSGSTETKEVAPAVEEVAVAEAPAAEEAAPEVDTTEESTDEETK